MSRKMWSWEIQKIGNGQLTTRKKHGTGRSWEGGKKVKVKSEKIILNLFNA